MTDRPTAFSYEIAHVAPWVIFEEEQPDDDRIVYTHFAVHEDTGEVRKLDVISRTEPMAPQHWQRLAELGFPRRDFFNNGNPITASEIDRAWEDVRVAVAAE